MKLVCLILCAYVLSLTVRPCCTDNDCGADLAGVKTGTAKTQDKPCTGCSLFFTCGTCVGFVIADPIKFNHILLPEKPVEIYADLEQPYVKQVYLSIWQPPQLS